MKKLAFALLVITLAACARPIAPTGGPKDTTPPVVVAEKSTPNLSTRFDAREFRLSFDEWIILQDAATQILVSPPLAKKPDVSLKGKTVIFRLNKADTLRANTTYTVNFGTAVKDLHENNPAKDLRFVFSTGDFIDSLSVAGVVIDAQTGDAAENIAVMLYDVLEDSIVRKERPYYLARTDKNGQYTIPNVRAGTFKCVAVDDANQNLKWDGENERIGFPDNAVSTNDSSRNIPAIRLFKPAPAQRLVTKNTGRYGLLRLGFTDRPDTVRVRPELPDLKWRTEMDKDTLLVWYDLTDSVAWKLTAGPDTVAVKALSRSAFLAANRLSWGDEAPPPVQGRQRGRPVTPQPVASPGPIPPKSVTVNLRKPLSLPFSTPIEAIDTSKWILEHDTLAVRAFSVTPDSAQPRGVLLTSDWLEGRAYRLMLLPGALTDFYGTTNADTLRRVLLIPSEKQLGILRLSLTNLVPASDYVLRLYNGNTLEEEQVFRADSTAAHFNFTQLQPVTYNVQLIEDRNHNREWDPGGYFAHLQPEPIFQKKLEPLRANWELEAVLEADPPRLNRQKKK